MGWDLANDPGKKGVEKMGGGMGDLPQSSAAGGEVCMEGRSARDLNTTLKNIGPRVGEARE